MSDWYEWSFHTQIYFLNLKRHKYYTLHENKGFKTLNVAKFYNLTIMHHQFLSRKKNIKHN